MIMSFLIFYLSMPIHYHEILLREKLFSKIRKRKKLIIYKYFKNLTDLMIKVYVI